MSETTNQKMEQYRAAGGPDTSTPVLILRLDHHGALGMTRSLGRWGIPVYGVHSQPDAPAFHSRYCRRGFVRDLDSTPSNESLDYLMDIADHIGGKPILLPSNDETSLFVAQNADVLCQRFLFPVNSARLVRSLVDKRLMSILAKECGIPSAECEVPNCREDVLRFCESARFPVMLKATDAISVARRTGKRMAIARTAAELLRLYDDMADPHHRDLMLQEYIPGGDDSVWMFNGYFDENSNCVVGFTGRKIHQNPVYTGMTALGICLKNETVDEMTRRFMKAIGYRGILDIGYRYDARDGLYKVLDVNPRVGATFRLFVGKNGLDVVRVMYLHLTGQPLPDTNLCEGRKWIVEDLDLISAVHYFRDDVLTLRQWLASLRGIQEAAWFASDDLKPFLFMITHLLSTPLRKASKHLADHSGQKVIGRMALGK